MADVPHLRVAFRYQQFDRKWWEVYGYPGADLSAPVAGLPAIIAASLAFRHPSVWISRVRISNPLATRQALTKHIPNPARVTGTEVPQTSSLACIYSLQATQAAVKRNVWFRGLRETDCRRNPTTGQDIQAGNLANEIDTFYAALVAAGYGIPSVNPASAGAYARRNISSIDVLPLGRVRINCDDTITYGDLKRMMLYKIDQHRFPGLRGTFTVAGDAAGFIPAGYLSLLAENNYPVTDGAFRTKEWRFHPFLSTGASFLAFDRRDTSGGPLGARGRSRPVITRSR